MRTTLIPVDGTPSSLQAVQHVANRFLADGSMAVHLLHARVPFSRHVARVTGKRNREIYHHEAAERALKDARALLDKRGVPYATHVELGTPATVIARVAQRLGVSDIVMGTARKNALARFIHGSVTSKVIDAARVPVEVVAAGQASWWERIGIPAAVGTALAALFVAALCVAAAD